MTAPDSGQERWRLTLSEIVRGVQARRFPPQTITNVIAARLAVDPKNVGVVIDEHLGRPFLRIEVAV